MNAEIHGITIQTCSRAGKGTTSPVDVFGKSGGNSCWQSDVRDPCQAGSVPLRYLNQPISTDYVALEHHLLNKVLPMLATRAHAPSGTLDASQRCHRRLHWVRTPRLLSGRIDLRRLAADHPSDRVPGGTRHVLSGLYPLPAPDFLFLTALVPPPPLSLSLSLSLVLCKARNDSCSGVLGWFLSFFRDT